jgi:hypothetical protein
MEEVDERAFLFRREVSSDAYHSPVGTLGIQGYFLRVVCRFEGRARLLHIERLFLYGLEYLQSSWPAVAPSAR